MGDNRSNSAGLVWVGLTPAQAEFVVKNADANIGLALEIMPTLERRETLEALVANVEEFKAIKAAVQKATS